MASYQSADWQTRALATVLEVQNGYAFGSEFFNNEASGLPLIRIRDLKNGERTEAHYSGAYDEKFLVRAGDLLIGMDGEFRCYKWRGPLALLNQRVCRLENFDASIDSN